MAINPIGNNAGVNINGNNLGVQPANTNFQNQDTFQAAGATTNAGGGGGSLSGKTKNQLFQMLILNMFETQISKKAEQDQQEADKDNSEGEGVGAGGGSVGGPSMADIIGQSEQSRIVAAMKNAKS
jgi:hypothetical protein